MVLAAVLAFAAVVVLVKVVPPWIASTDHLRGTPRAEEIGRARTAFLAILAGGVATVGAVFTGLSYRLNRRTAAENHALDQSRLITERFTRAIDQLGSTQLDVRLGGIYALERIARDSRADHPQVVEVLTAYVREHARWIPHGPYTPTSGPAGHEKPDGAGEANPPLGSLANSAEGETVTAAAEPVGQQPPSDARTEPPELPTDVQAAVSVLARRDPSQDRPGAQLDLTHTNLCQVLLVGAHLQGVRLNRANLEFGRLGEANLQDARLFEANLQHADLSKAHLERASLRSANLQGASLDKTHLQAARLSGAKLHHAWIGGADLRDAEGLKEENLRDAKGLDTANFEGTGLHVRFDPDTGNAHLVHDEEHGDASDSVPSSD